MIYTKLDRLAIINIDDDIDKVEINCLLDAIKVAATNLIYILCGGGVLRGIVSSGDIGRAKEEGLEFVDINGKFTRVYEGEYYKALEIFKNKSYINALPVLDLQNQKLKGEFSRYDDIVNYNKTGILDDRLIKYICERNYKICICINNSISIRKRIANSLYEQLKTNGVYVDNINDIKNFNESEYDYILCIDDDEMFGVGALGIIYEKGVRFLKKRYTIKGFCEKLYEDQLMSKCFDKLKSGGINVINIYSDEFDEWQVDFTKRLVGKYEGTGIPPYGRRRVEDFFVKEFFGEYYNEDYYKEVGIRGVINQSERHGLAFVEDVKGRYVNVVDGQRVTVGQPDKYSKKVVFVGQCFMFGVYCEDKHTIASRLQKMLLESRYDYKVINYASWENDYDRLRKLMWIYENFLSPGDIVISYFSDRKIEGANNLNVTDVLKQYELSEKWFTNHVYQGNYKVMEIYAKMLFNQITHKEVCDGDLIEYKENDLNCFLEKEYAAKYLENINPYSYNNVGTIVMNCNPFTNGHRYLIEKASKECDLLIIFVVEEDKSLFSFCARYEMVASGVKDLKNVLVIPSGRFVLSNATFPDYFVKTITEKTREDAEYDIQIFAERIAPYFNISKRYVGEELSDKVTAQYNAAMKTILPKYGIDLIEVPRKEIDELPISATSVRKCLENKDMKMLKKLVPQSTLDIMFFENK